MKTGIYETVYGNACEYSNGDNHAFDLDSARKILISLVNFEIYLGEVE